MECKLMNTMNILNEVENEKNRIRTALIIAGEYDIEGGMITYADLIREIKNRFMRKVKFGDSVWVHAPYLDISKHKDCSFLFYDCENVVDFQALDTSRAEQFSFMFAKCSALTSVPALDASKVELAEYMFEDCVNLTDFGGLINLGKGHKSNIFNFNHLIEDCENLSYTSAMNVINNLYDRASNDMSVLTIKFHPNVFALLSEEDIAIATNKGWIIS